MFKRGGQAFVTIIALGHLNLNIGQLGIYTVVGGG